MNNLIILVRREIYKVTKDIRFNKLGTRFYGGYHRRKMELKEKRVNKPADGVKTVNFK